MTWKELAAVDVGTGALVADGPLTKAKRRMLRELDERKRRLIRLLHEARGLREDSGEDEGSALSSSRLSSRTSSSE